MDALWTCRSLPLTAQFDVVFGEGFGGHLNLLYGVVQVFPNVDALKNPIRTETPVQFGRLN